MVDRDLREWIEPADKLGELKRINGADWNVEIGAVTELGHHRGEQSHALLFDNIKGYPEGYRVLSNTMNTVNRIAITLQMEPAHNRLDFVQKIKRHITDVKYIKPQVFPAVAESSPAVHRAVEEKWGAILSS